MGFRSVGITEHTGIDVPWWFKNKWRKELNIPVHSGKPTTPISYKFEKKWHDEIIEDLQKVVDEDKEWSGDSLDMIIFHECNGVTRARIFADKVQYFEPTDWVETSGITHFYCYGCSEPGAIQ